MEGKYHWHHYRYEPVRDLMERHYVDRFNEVSGHYVRLLESVRRGGFRNPIMVTAGMLDRRRCEELPPGYRQREDLIVSEYLGGSRLWAAGQLGVAVPCIVNDHMDVLPDAEALPDADAVLSKFMDRPGRIEMRRGGRVTLNDLPFVHLPPEERYSMRDQILIRRDIVNEIKGMVAEWLVKNDP